MSLMQFAILVVGVVLGLFVGLGLKSQSGKTPGLEDGRLKDCGSRPNAVCSEAGTQPERYVEPLSGSMDGVVDAIRSLGGTITSKSDDYVSATFMSPVFKFVDDVELRDGGDGVIHIRSASRVGYSDNGANRKRVERIRAAMEGPR